MPGEKHPADATLLDVLIDGFEKNEMLHGFHMRTLPMPDETAAAHKFTELLVEGRRWKGDPLESESGPGRQLVRWSDLEIRQAGRAIMVRVKAPRFDSWWHEAVTWAGDPMQPIFDWIHDETSHEGQSPSR